MLVKAKASIEAQDDSKATPLHLAAMFGEVEAIKALVKAGASLRARTADEKTPLDVAMDEESRQTLVKSEL